MDKVKVGSDSTTTVIRTYQAQISDSTLNTDET